LAKLGYSSAHAAHGPACGLNGKPLCAIAGSTNFYPVDIAGSLEFLGGVIRLIFVFAKIAWLGVGVTVCPGLSFVVYRFETVLSRQFTYRFFEKAYRARF
jgi:hypothetical protein